MSSSDIEKLDQGLQAVDPLEFAISAGQLLSNLARDPFSAADFLSNLQRFGNIEEALTHLERMTDLAFEPKRAGDIKLGINIGFVSLLRYVEVEQTRRQVEGS